MPDDNVIRNLEAQAAQRRKHATFFTWHDRSAEGKGVAEAGIANDLLTAMEAEQRREYRNLGPSGDQWPDVWLQDSTGRRVPCEVAELVDQAALPAGDARPQGLGELVERLQKILERKAMRSLGGRSGQQSVVVIYSDEFYLNADNVAPVLLATRFKKPLTIQRAFLVLSYDPNRGGYRYFELQLAGTP